MSKAKAFTPCLVGFAIFIYNFNSSRVYTIQNVCEGIKSTIGQAQ